MHFIALSLCVCVCVCVCREGAGSPLLKRSTVRVCILMWSRQFLKYINLKGQERKKRKRALRREFIYPPGFPNDFLRGRSDDRTVPSRPRGPTCSKVHVHKVIEDDGHLAVAEGVQHHLAPEVLVAGVLGVHGHRRVPQHGLETRGGHHHLLII